MSTIGMELEEARGKFLPLACLDLLLILRFVHKTTPQLFPVPLKLKALSFHESQIWTAMEYFGYIIP
jgi:hypothetical protein